MANSSTTTPRNTALATVAAREAMGIVDPSTSGSLAPVPLQGLPGAVAISPEQQGELMSQIVAAMRKMAQPEFAGTGGSLEGTIVRMPLRRLWINPLWPVEYTDREQLRALGASLKERQQEPLIVSPALDPNGGVPYQVRDHVIVQGKQRFLAAPYGGLTELRVEVVRYPTLYHLMLAAVAGKVSHHPITDVQFALLLLRLKQSHDLAREANPDLPKFPTQDQLAALLGVSQGTIAKRMALADAGELMPLLTSGRITVAQAYEMVHAHPVVQRVVAATVVEANAERAASNQPPVPSKDVRDAVQDARTQERKHREPMLRLTPPPPEVALPSNVILPDTLWLDGLYEMPPNEAIAHLVHDLAASLKTAMAAMERPSGWVVAVQRALSSPDVQRFLRDTYPEATN